jgi:hypothetical protein
VIKSVRIGRTAETNFRAGDRGMSGTRLSTESESFEPSRAISSRRFSPPISKMTRPGGALDDGWTKMIEGDLKD